MDPNSTAIAANLNAQVHTYYGAAALNTYAYSSPIYTVPVDQPVVNVTWSNCQHQSWQNPGLQAVLQNVPIPANAVPSQGTDGAMVIYQPSTDTEWEFWKAAQDASGNWSACWAGRIGNVSQSSGAFPYPYGPSASGLSLLGHLVRISELQAGSINHVLGIEMPHVRAYTYSWPANRTDGNSTDPTAPAEGERLRLDPTLDLSTLHLSAGELMIARALQRYGAIVTDQSGAVAIQAEDPRPYEVGGAADPYASYFSGPQYNWLRDIPWSRLQVVAWNYGSSGS